MALLLLPFLVAIFSLAPASHGFTPMRPAASLKHQLTRYLMPPENNEEAQARARNDARIDVRNLLTQRAIQTFVYLCESVRDPHSGKWIEDFLEAPNQLQYHGTGAAYFERFGGTWDAPLLEMIKRDKDVVVVSAKRSGKGHKGWSKNNPYLEDRYVEFNIDIDPVSLANRILSVREQIANEWKQDLDILGQANQQILESYSKMMKEQRDAELQGQTPGTSAFERFSMTSLNFQTSFTAQVSSPLRKGNFDLLCNLCTQASVHRLLRQLKESESERDASFTWLRDFYSDRVAEFFDGNQQYGRADDFIEELILAAPSVFKTADGKGGIVDTMALAENIITLRTDIVEEWKEIMTNIPQEHSNGIRKVVLDKQMAAWGSSTPLGGESSGSFQ